MTAPRAPQSPLNLRSIDLNLIVVLQALLEERSVKKAGDRLGLSPSATSHALNRLRAALGDEILIRTQTGMEPTERAASLEQDLTSALLDIQIALAPPAFDPASAEFTFNLGVETYETLVVLPGLLELVEREAPGVNLMIRTGSVEEMLNHLDQGTLDVAIGAFRDAYERYMTCALFSDDHVCVMRRDHPLAGGLDLDDYLRARHLVISMSGSSIDVVDQRLAEQGLHRRVALRLPNGLAAMVALERTDHIATLSRKSAGIFVAEGRCVQHELPFPGPTADFRLIWHRRAQKSAPHAWLRRKLVDISAAVGASRR